MCRADRCVLVSCVCFAAMQYAAYTQRRVNDHAPRRSGPVRQSCGLNLHWARSAAVAGTTFAAKPMCLYAD